eukprot:jgi/Picre1/28915/NNA_004311.t1
MSISLLVVLVRGTLSGTGKFLKEKNPDCQVIAVEPEESPVISGGRPGPHKIQGIGAGFIPKNLDTKIVDEAVTVSSEDAMKMARRLATRRAYLWAFLWCRRDRCLEGG